MAGFKTQFSEEKRASMVTPELRERLVSLLQERKQYQAIQLVIAETEMGIVDAIVAVNDIFLEVDDEFRETSRGRR